MNLDYLQKLLSDIKLFESQRETVVKHLNEIEKLKLKPAPLLFTPPQQMTKDELDKYEQLQISNNPNSPNHNDLTFPTGGLAGVIGGGGGSGLGTLSGQYTSSNLSFDNFPYTSEVLDQFSNCFYIVGVNKDNDNLEIIKGSDKTKLSVEESLYLVSTILSNTVFGKDPMMRLFSEGMKKEIIDKCDEIITKYTNRTKTSGENNGIDRV